MKKLLLAYAKKSFSLFMAVMMLLSCWVFVAPEKAEALVESYGTYTMKFVVTADDASNNGGHINIHYYPWKTDGSGFSTTSQIYSGNTKISSDMFKNTETITVSDIKGYPFKVEFVVAGTGMSTYDVDVVTYFMGTQVASNNLSGGWTGAKTTTINHGATGWTTPYENSVSGLADKTIQLGTSGSASATAEATIKDQYGVAWNWSPKYTITNASGNAPTGVTLTENENTDGTHGGVTVTVAGLSALCSANSYNASTGEVKLTLKAAVNSGSASQSKTITIKSPTYYVTFLDSKDAEYKKLPCYYNGGVTAPAAPAKDPDTTYHYVFSKWDDSTPYTSGVTKDMTVGPIYTPVAHTFTPKDDNSNYVDLGNGKHWLPCDAGCGIYGYGNTAEGTASCTYGAWEINGTTFTHKCIYCGHSESETHTFFEDTTTKGAVITKESCYNGGEYYLTCNTCGKTHTSQGYTNETFTVDPLEHLYTQKGPTTAHTCDKNGYVTYYCKHCGTQSSMNDEYKRNADNTYVTDENGNYVLLDPAAHTWAGNVTDNGNGQHGYACIRKDGCTDPDTGWKDLADHNYTELIGTTREPNCTDAGWGTFKCSDCTATQEREIGTNGVHNFTGAPVNQGEDGHSYLCTYGCNTSGNVIDGVQVENATVPHTPVYTDTGSDDQHKVTCDEDCGYEVYVDHSWDETKREGLTCWTNGTVHYECSLCKATKTEDLPAIGHANKQHVAAVDPTCDDEGNYEYWYCPDCKTYYKDEACTDAYENEAATVIAALGHEYSTDNKDAVSNNDGTHSFKCIRYGKGGCTATGNTVDCSFGEYERIDGESHQRTCSICNYVEVESHEGHWSEWTSDDTDNTTTKGTHSRECTLCGSKQTKVDCEYDLTEEVMSTCSTAGYETYTCKDCGHGYTVIKALDPANHTGEPTHFENGYAATCKETGYEGDIICKCGEKLGDGKELPIDPKNHADYGTTTTGAVTPTCKVEGFTGTTTCNGCQAVISKNKSLGYDKNNHVNVTQHEKLDATCTEIGHTAYTECDDCGTIEGFAQIPALGHDYNGGEVVELDGDIHTYKCVRYGEGGCTSTGVDKKEGAVEDCSGGEATCTDKAVCEVCGDEYGELELHSFTSGIYATYEIDGVKYHNQKCISCDAYGTGYIVDAKEACAGGEANCEDAAICSVCKEAYGEALGHDFSMAKNRVNCHEDGYHNWKCFRCDKFGIVNADGTQEVGGKVACVATGSVVTPPTCTESGYTTYACDYCGHEWTGDTTAPTGHKYTQKIIDDAHIKSVSTCTGATVYWFDCIGCDMNAKDLGITDDPSLYYENGSAAGHTWNGKEYKYKATDATCTKNETYYVYCSVCEEAVNHDETFEKPDTKLSHEWEETKTYPQSAADCDSAATYYKECKNCHESSKDHDGSTWVDGEALGHDFSSQIKDVAHRKNKANCVAPATYYYDCSRCDANAKLLTDGTADDWTYTDGEVDPKNHTDLVLVPFKAADCTEAGHNAHKKCEGCKVEIGKVVYDALGHDFTGEYVPVTPTTHKRACANDGCTAYSDVENCSFESSEWKQVEGTDTHKRECVCGNSEVGDCEGGKSTCTEKATCTICGGKYGTTTDHKYADKWTSDGEGTNTHSKACLNDGCTAKKTEKCSGGNAATCSQKSICSECNTAYGSLADHSFVNYVTTKAPTCYTNEEKTATCEFNCGTTDTVVIPNSNLTHDMSDGYVVTKEPTCKEEGIQTNTCKHGCGHSVTQTIPAVKDAHISSDWIKEDASADCSTGIRYYKECTVCGDILETKTEEGQHEWDAVVTVKPTCITDGYINYVCTNCGFTKTENPEELKANGEHTWGEMIVTKAATCSNKGRGYYECELCGAQSEAKEIDKLDHTSRRYVDPVAPTCEKKGHNGYWNCLDCSYSSRESDEYVEYPALGHNDKNNDGICDDCKFVIYDKDGDNDIDGSCGCICHNNSWFGQLIYKICNFFWKLFKIKPSCNCGHKHY